MPSAELRINLTAVETAGEMVLASCDEISRIARRLRLPARPPAADLVSLHLTEQLNHSRLSLGCAGAAAADELARMIEFITAGAHHLAALSSTTTAALMGLAATPAAAPAIRPGAVAHPLDSPPALEPLTSADDALTFAVLLGGGAPDWAPQFLDTADLDTAAAAVAHAADLLAEALSYGHRPAATLSGFSAWIGDYSSAIAALNAGVGEWAGRYRTIRPLAEAAGAPYVTFLAATVAGHQALAPDPSAAWAALEQYRAVRLPAAELADFPRLRI